LNEEEPEVEGNLVSSSGTGDEAHDHASISAVSVQLSAVSRIYTQIYNFILIEFQMVHWFETMEILHEMQSGESLGAKSFIFIQYIFRNGFIVQ
jgi:hypothetical protein